MDVGVPKGQLCCGLPLFNSGYRRQAARLARRTIPLFEGADRVVVPSGSCAWMIKAEYPHLFPDDPAVARAAESLAGRTCELSQLLARLPRRSGQGSGEGAAPRRAETTRVTYHDSCHLLRGLGEATAPRQLLHETSGIELTELPGASECCGFGGSFAVRLPDVSVAILGRKLANVRATGADCVVTCDAGCLMQMAGGAARSGDRFRVRHLAEVLASAEVGDGGD